VAQKKIAHKIGNFDKFVRYELVITIVSLLLNFNPMVTCCLIFGDHVVP